MAELDIGIIGCGPAGLAAALFLARDGNSVTLFERFDTPEPLGSGLLIQPTGLAVLDKLGLAEKLAARGARIKCLKGIQQDGRVALDAHYRHLPIPGAFGIGTHRASLFQTLYDAVNSQNIPLVTGKTAVEAPLKAGKRRINFEDGTRSEAFDLVVDATGWMTKLTAQIDGLLPYGALWANIAIDSDTPVTADTLEQRYGRATKMAGILPIGSRADNRPTEVAFFWSMRGDDYAKWCQRDLEDWKQEVAHLWPEASPLLAGIEDRSQLTFARYAHRTASKFAEDRLASIGDAWHCASPQLGQGANMALLDAWALARGIREGKTIQEGLRLAGGWRADHIAIYQLITAIFTPLYQSDASFPPWVRDNILAPLSQTWPANRIQSRIMAGTFGWSLGQLGLEAPDYSAIASAMAARASSLSQ